MTIAFYGAGNSFAPQAKTCHDLPTIFDDIKNYPVVQPLPDIFTPSNTTKVEQPKIGFLRLCFSRLTQEQIDTINTTGELPKNAKFVDNQVSGEPILTWNLADITKGTHKLPVGYELKNDILGFTHVVREGTQAWFFKK